ncbi:MAG TPA: PPC domain-containing protein [Candidatus Polarisedimenticolaceae bacterium]|nr:PPC domain-containing protein [Candidatus Polarisedimenticolaceae bacterium]
MRIRRVLTTSVLVGVLALGAAAAKDPEVSTDPVPPVSRGDVFQRIDPELSKAQSLVTRADQLLAEGRQDDAIELLHRVVAMELPAMRESDKLVAEAYLRLGDVYGDPTRAPLKAVVFYGSAIERLSMDDDAVVISETLRRISSIYLSAGDEAASARIEGMLVDIATGNPPAEFGLVPSDPGATTRDAGDDTCDMSIAVAVPHAEQMSINPAFDENWRDFTLTEPRVVRIETLDADTLKDTVLELWDGCPGTSIDFDDDGGPGLLSLIESDCLEPGTYYVEVRAFSAGTPQNFTLSITDEACPTPPLPDQYEPDNEPAQAGKIGFRNNGNGEGNQNGRDNKQIQRHSIFPAPDLDYVYFGLSRNNWVNIETLGVDGGNPDTVIGLTNEGGVLHAVNDDRAAGQFTSQLRACLPAGNWFVPILPFFFDDEFDYDVLVDVEGSCLFETEPNGQCSLATPITLGEVWNGIHAPQGLTFETDWFSFEIEETSFVSIETSGYDDFDVDTYLELYNACGGSLLDSDDDGGPGFTSRIDILLDPGTYYLLNRLSPIALASGVTYPYSLTITASEPPLAEIEPNNSCGQANAVELGDSVEASISPIGDYDSFLLSVPSEGLIDIETTGGSGDTVLSIADSAGNVQIGCDDDDGEGFFSKWSCCLPAGDYCVSVKDWGNNSTISSYTINFTDLGSCTPNEPLVCDIAMVAQCSPF